MKRTILTASSIALIATFIAVGAFAEKRQGPDGEGKKHDRIQHMMEKLDLTAEQQEKVKALKKDHREEAKPIREKLQVLKKEMHTLWKTDNPNEEKIISKHKKIHSLKGQLAELRIEFRLDVHALLTPQQRQKAQSFKENHPRGKRGKHKGPRK